MTDPKIWQPHACGLYFYIDPKIMTKIVGVSIACAQITNNINQGIAFPMCKLRRIGRCHTRSSLRASRAFRDAARSNIAPHVSPSLLARRRASLARRPWKCRLLGTSRTPPLARTRAPLSLALWIGEPPPPTWEPPPLLRIEEPPLPRVEVMELRPPAGGPPSRTLWGNRRRRTRRR
jgi:hypothetical protein